ncbi:MAG: hypothetical protein IPJ28_22145 [Betaproteobacteria bacterium]|nr:hypothetical protein [Betaproteobacteria bacterium]
MKILSALPALLLAPALVLAMPPAAPDPAKGNPHATPPSPWADLAEYAISLKVPPKGATGQWKIRTFDDPSDVSIELDTPAAKGRTQGTLLLVGGQAIAFKGFAPEAGFEIDPLDTAIVNLKLVTNLLTRIAPEGPDAVKAVTPVKLGDGKQALVAYTRSINMQFNAPWSVTGQVKRVDAKTVGYDLTIEAPGAKAGERLKWQLKGTAGGATRGKSLDDAMSLAGWSAYRLAPPSSKTGHTTLSFGTQKLAGPYATMKDLRAALAKP